MLQRRGYLGVVASCDCVDAEYRAADLISAVHAATLQQELWAAVAVNAVVKRCVSVHPHYIWMFRVHPLDFCMHIEVTLVCDCTHRKTVYVLP